MSPRPGNDTNRTPLPFSDSRPFAAAICFLAVALCPLQPTTSLAAQFGVNTTVDQVDANPGDGTCATESGVCSLRAAVQEANALPGPDSVLLPAAPAAERYSLTISGAEEDAAATGDLDVLDDLMLAGTGSGLVVIEGDVTDRVFDVFSPATVEITDLVIQDANVVAAAGGGIRNAGVLTLRAVTLRDNVAVDGGGIANLEEGSLTLENCTLSGNAASALGGGLANFDDASATILNTTITNNASVSGGSGIHNLALVELRNTIVAGNSGEKNCTGSIDGTVSLGHNLESANSCFLSADSDLRNTPAGLGMLADNGGHSLTHALLAGSAAIDSGDNGACPERDQRNALRPFDGDGDGTASCDIGAYEAGASFPPTATATATGSPTPTGTLLATPTPTVTPTNTPVTPTPTGTLPSPTPSTTPTPTSTSTTVPSATPTLSATPTATAVLPTITPTATPVPATPTSTPEPVEVVIGSATGMPGERVTFDVTLRTGPVLVGSVQHDVGYDSLNLRIATLPGGGPVCELNPQLGKASVFLLRPPQCEGEACDTLFAAVFSVQPPITAIPDGSVLYICEMEISPTAAAGAYALAGSRIVASDLEGFAIERVVGIDGTILVQEAPTPVPTATPVPCVGDCNGDGEVTVDELLTMVNIALGNLPVTACPAGDGNGDDEVTVEEILLATNHALRGCAAVAAATAP
jgi:CSLREA domain-containing protein